MFHVKHEGCSTALAGSLFHVKHLERLERLGSEFGFALHDEQLRLLEAYSGWLEREALEAGGIGPNEQSQLLGRHVGDALTWLRPMERAPASLLDIGSGVGLPGIPLAITLENTEITLLDRSGRRCGLLRRVIRVLDLQNVEVRQADIAQELVQHDVVVSRASLPPQQLLPHLQRLTLGIAIVGGSTTGPIEVPGYSTVKIESRYLDSPRWLLIMQRS